MSYKNLISTLKSIDRLFDSDFKHEEDSLVSYLINTIKKQTLKETEDIKTIEQLSKANINDDNKEKTLYIHVNIIKCALKSTPSRKMSVDEICQWINLTQNQPISNEPKMTRQIRKQQNFAKKSKKKLKSSQLLMKFERHTRVQRQHNNKILK
jgi:hypothetical protein